ncbi:DALR anticodon-binding domain-containing protein [Nostoc sp. UHCC 0302]|uniref:DALR anticodon-binding domain-containing protein n=1 Tax=Nostoc sp. UHCC 0302 TaxID=3134896 RepID=UPI00311CCAF2
MSENEEIYGTQLFKQIYVHHRLLVSKYTAIKRSIHSYLADVLSIYTKNEKSVLIEARNIPLSKGRNGNQIFYVSGVAMRLSKSQNQKSIEIANAIASHLLGICGDIFKVQIVPPGWIYLQLTDSALAAWLQSLAVGSLGQEIREEKGQLIPNPQYPIPIAPYPQRGAHLPQSLVPNSLFAVQYAHARCCSLVLLAHREGLIELREPVPDTSPVFWSVLSCNSLPWLNCDGKLRFNHPDEHFLIAELVQVVDNLDYFAVSGSWNWEKAALKLSQAFENFWRNCRIWGEMKITSSELAQARLGLVMATQSVLRLLLEEKLGIFAPLEL